LYQLILSWVTEARAPSNGAENLTYVSMSVVTLKFEVYLHLELENALTYHRASKNNLKIIPKIDKGHW